MGSFDRDTEEGAFLPPFGVSLIELVEVRCVTENVGFHWQLKSEFFTQNLSHFVSEVYSWMFD